MNLFHYHQRIKPAGGVGVLYVYGLDGELLAEVDAGTGKTSANMNIKEIKWLVSINTIHF
ncbi:MULTISPECIES: hypothetical protein [Gammaproteobacteria]|uniref:Uncharacterized protein n=3 Tax=Vibrio TaxID=662 RepID=A0A1P8DQX9_VIBPH|nr:MULTISPECIES: hypothetical protein [Gammaproteobacteria]EKO3796768.1 hypothetical protein [Vibrio metschnikovii]RJX66125.1 hypothetical protein DZ860_20610 [Vibrio sinensis]HCJ6891865.1 hypothetical protein [Vibrio cholerae]APU91515.1 hypothetical protein [Vibrio parahaemolyticus]MBO0199384.1 hypothetical protein [Vibrio alginolyticus]